MLARYAFVALFAFPLALAAQTPCVDGQAGDYACDGVDLLAHIPRDSLDSNPSVRGNDMWGWTDPETGTEYALIGQETGTVFIDLSVPTAPVIVGTLPGECSQTWRDMKVYADHAFIVADGCNHGIQVFDLTQLRDVANPPVTFTPDAHYTGLGNAHNIAILEEAALAFPVGSSACSSQLEIVDISSPLNPAHEGCFGDQQSTYVHDTECVRYDGPDTDYTGHDICFNMTGFGGSLVIVDVSNPSAPQFISRAFYQPDATYSHQGWLSEDQRFFFLDDEITTSVGGTRTYVFDLEDLDNPSFDYMFQGETDAGAHNMYVLDGFAYQSNYEGGLRILDVRNPGQPASIDEVAYFDTYPPSDNPSPGNYNGTWSNYPFFESGIVVVNDRDNGVFVLQPTALPTDTTPDPTPPDQLVVRLTGPNPAGMETAISINPPTDQEVTVDLVDAEGRVLRSLGARFARAGHETSVAIDVRDLPGGTYFLRVRGEHEEQTVRIAVVR